jgi:hypothetical protein
MDEDEDARSISREREKVLFVPHAPICPFSLLISSSIPAVSTMLQKCQDLHNLDPQTQFSPIGDLLHLENLPTSPLLSHVGPIYTRSLRIPSNKFSACDPPANTRSWIQFTAHYSQCHGAILAHHCIPREDVLPFHPRSNKSRVSHA